MERPRDSFCDYQHCTHVMQRYKLHRMLETKTGKVTRKDYKERYFVHFQDDRQNRK